MVPFRNITLEFCLAVRLNPAWSLIDTCLSESPVIIWKLQRVCMDETVRVWCVKFPFCFKLNLLSGSQLNTRNTTTPETLHITLDSVHISTNISYIWKTMQSTIESSWVRYIEVLLYDLWFSSRLRYPAFSISYETFSCRPEPVFGMFRIDTHCT